MRKFFEIIGHIDLPAGHQPSKANSTTGAGNTGNLQLRWKAHPSGVLFISPSPHPTPSQLLDPHPCCFFLGSFYFPRRLPSAPCSQEASRISNRGLRMHTTLWPIYLKPYLTKRKLEHRNKSFSAPLSSLSLSSLPPLYHKSLSSSPPHMNIFLFFQNTTEIIPPMENHTQPPCHRCILTSSNHIIQVISFNVSGNIKIYGKAWAIIESSCLIES